MHSLLITAVINRRYEHRVKLLITW